MILLWSANSFLIISWTAISKSSAFSSSSAASLNDSATIVFNTTFAGATESEEPTIRNSNLLPVNANGDVRLRSVASLSRSGSVATPVISLPPFLEWVASPVLHNWSITSSSWSPTKMEMIAGGASFAPSLWSFPTSDAASRSRSAWISTAFMIQARTNRNWMFSWGVSPGFSKLMPSSEVKDQLLCLPEPFTPANGFSWSRQVIWWRSATFFMVSMTIWLLSTARFAWS